MLLKKVVERINFVINEPELGFLCLHPFGWAVCLGNSKWNGSPGQSVWGGFICFFEKKDEKKKLL